MENDLSCLKLSFTGIPAIYYSAKLEDAFIGLQLWV